MVVAQLPIHGVLAAYGNAGARSHARADCDPSGCGDVRRHPAARGRRAQLWTHPARGNHAPLGHNPRIQGGEPTDKGTRVPVRSVVLIHRLYHDVERVRRAFPMLDTQAIHEALAYYQAHRAEIDRYIAENESGDEG